MNMHANIFPFETAFPLVLFQSGGKIKEIYLCYIIGIFCAKHASRTIIILIRAKKEAKLSTVYKKSHVEISHAYPAGFSCSKLQFYSFDRGHLSL